MAVDLSGRGGERLIIREVYSPSTGFMYRVDVKARSKFTETITLDKKFAQFKFEDPTKPPPATSSDTLTCESPPYCLGIPGPGQWIQDAPTFTIRTNLPWRSLYVADEIGNPDFGWFWVLDSYWRLYVAGYYAEFDGENARCSADDREVANVTIVPR